MNNLAAITQSSPLPTMSSRYVHVNTMDVIDVMQGAGFTVAEQKADKSRLHGAEYQRHMVIFRNDALSLRNNTYTPQMLWINSHNGKTPAMMRLGMYRFVCANGMVVGNDLASERIRHVGDLAKQVIDRVKTLSAQSLQVFGQIDKWEKVDMSKEQRHEFATRAAKLRFGEKAAQYNVEDILGVRRAEDDKGDLWTVFNRVQENTVKGGLVGRNANNRRVQTRSLEAIGLDVSYNQKLWELAEEFA